MVFVFITAVAAVRTVNRTAMLTATVICPRSVGKIVILIIFGNIRITFRTVFYDFMLILVVFVILGFLVMIAVIIPVITAAVLAVVVPAVSGRTVIFPILILIIAVFRPLVHKFVTLDTVFVPVAVIPFGVGDLVIADVFTVDPVSAFRTFIVPAAVMLDFMFFRKGAAVLVFAAVVTPMPDVVFLVRPLGIF